MQNTRFWKDFCHLTIQFPNMERRIHSSATTESLTNARLRKQTVPIHWSIYPQNCQCVPGIRPKGVFYQQHTPRGVSFQQHTVRGVNFGLGCKRYAQTPVWHLQALWTCW